KLRARERGRDDRRVVEGAVEGPGRPMPPRPSLGWISRARRSGPPRKATAAPAPPPTRVGGPAPIVYTVAPIGLTAPPRLTPGVSKCARKRPCYRRCLVYDLHADGGPSSAV